MTNNSRKGLEIMVLFSLIAAVLISSCAKRYVYIPPPDAEMNRGHFLLFFNEIISSEGEHPEPFQPKTVTVQIVQQEDVIISDNFESGNYMLYPIPEGNYAVQLEIEVNEEPYRIERNFEAKIETVNCLKVDFWQVEPTKLKADVQTKRALFSGEQVGSILNAKRNEKALTFERLMKMKS